MTSGTPPSGPSGEQRSSAGERDELDELRNRVRALESTERSPAARHHRFRSTGSFLLLLLASLLSLLAVVSVWADSIVRDTDRYVATVGPLASNPDVQKAITNRVTTAVLAQVDVDALVKELEQAAKQKGAPPKAAELLGDLKGPITSGLKSLVSDVVERVVAGKAFDTVWVNANRRAHSAIDKALTGESDSAVVVKNGQVAIDLGPIVAQVKDRLVSAGFKPAAKIPAVHTEFVVFASEDVGKIKWYLRVLEIIGSWLPLIVVLIAAAGVYLAVHRRRALIGVALGVFAAMLLLGITLSVLRSVYLDHLPAGASDAAAGAVYDSLVKFLRAGVRTVGAVALVTAIGAFLVGPTRVAVLTRTGCRKAIGALRDVSVSAGLPLGAVGRFVHRYKQWIGGVILVVAAVVLFTWDYPTVAVVVWTLVIVLIAFAIREFLDSGTPDTPSAATPSD
ncbi:hypothetical protein AB0H86_13030 [Streptomyces sp. NPDC050997]|uniref:hypothetical protein n=1 Tax=Streptomyces sp. NPDC050997 TaxID=3155519 RepID=UPI00343B5B88